MNIKHRVLTQNDFRQIDKIKTLSLDCQKFNDFYKKAIITLEEHINKCMYLNKNESEFIIEVYKSLQKGGQIYMSEKIHNKTDEIIDKLKYATKYATKEAVEEPFTFELTSDEARIDEYNKGIIFDDFEGTAKTKKNKFMKELKVKDKNGKTKDSYLETFFTSPLSAIKEQYNISIQELRNNKITNVIAKTKHFDVRSFEERIYNAISALIYKKTTYKIEKINEVIFISLNEIWKQLGNKNNPKPKDKTKLLRTINKLNNLKLHLNFSKVQLRNYKDFANSEVKETGTIQEPLINVISIIKAKQKYKKTLRTVEGIETVITKFMQLHFRHESQTNYYYSESEQQKEHKITRLEFEPKLKAYIKVLYFKRGKGQTTTLLSDGKIFEVLKEFNIKEQYEKAKKNRHGMRFLNSIYKIIENTNEVNSLEKNEKNVNVINWNKCK